MKPEISPEFRINDGDHELRLTKGSQVSFGADRWIDPQALFLMAACARDKLGGPVLCQNILPGVDMCANVVAENEAELSALWPGVAQFLHDWVESGNGQTRHLWSQNRQNWVCLSRHGAETFDDVALTIERLWPSGIANAGI